MPVANDTILLGQHGEIHAGQPVPASYVDTKGDECHTDFDRLSELGLLRDDPAPTAKRGPGRPRKNGIEPPTPAREPESEDA